MDKKILDRYNTLEAAVSYEGKYRRHWTERINNWREVRLVRRLVQEAVAGKPVEWALDLPCGVGRLRPIVQESAKKVVEGDWSLYMLQLARELQRNENDETRSPHYTRATALSLPFHDRAFDLVLSVRLCHHIREQSERLQYLNEIMRVSARFVIFTYFDRDSLKNQLREFRRRFNKKRSKWTLSSEEIRASAQEANFQVDRIVPLSPLFSGHSYAVLRRQ